jgi:hypothetical protein
LLELLMSFEVLTIYAVVAVNLVIGIRLVQKGRRNNAKPELILGWALTFDASEWFLWYLSAYTPADGTSLGDAFGFACRVCIAATVFGSLVPRLCWVGLACSARWLAPRGKGTGTVTVLRVRGFGSSR